MKSSTKSDPYATAQQALEQAQRALSNIPRPPPTTSAEGCTSCDQLRAKIASIEESRRRDAVRLQALSESVAAEHDRATQLQRECQRLLARIVELEASPDRAQPVSDVRNSPKQARADLNFDAAPTVLRLKPAAFDDFRGAHYYSPLTSSTGKCSFPSIFTCRTYRR